jgi:hypothetical protein
VADRYIDEAYVYAAMGANVVRSQLSGSGISLSTIIEQSTGTTKGFLRANGYTPPTTQDPASITESMVKEATMALVRMKLCSMPERTLPLPEDWNDHPEKLALNILRAKHEKGDAILDLPQSTVGSPGGATFTNTTTAPQRQPRASSDQLKGY